MCVQDIFSSSHRWLSHRLIFFIKAISGLQVQGGVPFQNKGRTQGTKSYGLQKSDVTPNQPLIPARNTNASAAGTVSTPQKRSPDPHNPSPRRSGLLSLRSIFSGAPKHRQASLHYQPSPRQACYLANFAPVINHARVLSPGQHKTHHFAALHGLTSPFKRGHQ